MSYISFNSELVSIGRGGGVDSRAEAFYLYNFSSWFPCRPMFIFPLNIRSANNNQSPDGMFLAYLI